MICISYLQCTWSINYTCYYTFKCGHKLKYVYGTIIYYWTLADEYNIFYNLFLYAEKCCMLHYYYLVKLFK